MSSWSRPAVFPSSPNVANYRTSNVAVHSLSGSLKLRRSAQCSSHSTTWRMFTTAGKDETDSVLEPEGNSEAIETPESYYRYGVMHEYPDLDSDTIREMEIDGVKHLSCISPSDQTTMHGITFGDHHRVLAMAVLSAKGKSVNAIMLVDTGSPYTFLTEETFNALGFNVEDTPTDNGMVMINGRWLNTHLSRAHFVDLNILGSNFLQSCKLHVNYLKETAQITIKGN